MLYCSIGYPCDAQPTGWKLIKFGKATISYPANWHIANDTHENQSRVSMTPDSMQQLNLRLVVLFDLPTDDQHTFALFKKNFVGIVQPSIGPEAKMSKIEEISFKGHKCMYAEIARNSLPIKLYAINAGNDMYIFLLTLRRYSQVADTAMERDEMAILNSFAFKE
jgi:hypothetical protein